MFFEYLLIYLGGLLTLLLIVFHLLFYKVFNWQKELSKINLLNKRIFLTIHIALILVFIIFAFISFFNTKELLNNSKLSITILMSISFFWFWRLTWQLIYFNKPDNDKINKPRPLQILLVFWFLLLFLFYLIPVIL